MRKFFKVIYYFGGIFLFVLFAIIGYTQTRSFKNYLHHALLEESRTLLNGNLELGMIDGNLVTGFTMNGLTLSDSSGLIISTEHVEFKYDPFGFMFKRIAISNAKIINPHIHLYRSMDGSYNFERIIKPIPRDTLPSKWTIDIKNFELTNADVSFTDSLLLHQRKIGDRELPPDSAFDYAQVHLSSLSLAASVQIHDEIYSAKIRKFSCSSLRQALVLNQFAGDFNLSKKEASVSNVTIETPNSHVRLNASLKGINVVNIADLKELEKIPIELSFSANDIDTKELKKFIYPSVDFLDGECKLKLKARGTFGDLNIEQLSIQLPHTLVQLQGQLRNLHQPDDLEIAAYGNNNYIEPRDLLESLPGLHLPNLAFLGKTTFSLSYQGKPLDFSANVNAKTAAGDIDVDGKMKIEPNSTIYSGKIDVHSLALGTILKDESLSSSLNAKITIDGSNFDPKSMTGLFKVEMDTSLFNGLPIGSSVFVFDIADGVLRAHAAASVGISNYEISSYVKLFSNDSIKYSISGKIRSLDLAELLKEKKYESDLTFDLKANGTIGAFVRSDTVDLNFYRSKFNVETFETAQVNIIHNTIDSITRKMQIVSTAGDLNVEGNFTPASFIAMCDNSYRLVTEAVAFRFNNLDSLRLNDSTITVTKKFSPSHHFDINPLEAQFQLRVKDFRPFGVFLHVPLSGQGVLEGSAAGDSTDMQLGGKVFLEQFGMLAGTDTLFTDTTSIQYFFGGINHQNMFELFNASLELEMQNLDVNSLLFNQVSGQIIVESDSSNIRLSALIDSTVRVDLEGASRVNKQLMEFDISELKVEVGEYVAENTDTVRLALGRDGFHVRSLSMEHESEEVLIDGYFSPTGISDLNISLSRFLISDLKQILHRGGYAKSTTQFGGIVDAKLLFRGSLSSPNIILDMQAEGVRADDPSQNKHKVLGKIDSRLSYYEHMLNMSVKFMSKTENTQIPPDLLLTGSLPFEFVLAREKPHKLEGEVDLYLQSSGMNLEFLDPFVPEISNLSGTMVCDMRMKGPIETPRYEGSMSIQKASLVFDPIGIKYILNGDLIPTGDRIRLQRFTIQNVPEKPFQAGTMNVSGSFTLLGLKLNQFSILAKGDLMVMRDDKRLVGQKLYGNLFAATGPDGLEWQGNLSASTVRGEIFVKEAELVLPPEREADLVRASVVNITYKDDTSKIASANQELVTTNIGKNKNLISDGKTSNKTVDSPLSSEFQKTSFLDGISYEMSIETQGPTTLRFVFNTQTSEELYADLQGRLYFNRTPASSRLTGQVEVGNRSYYNFIKRFEARGNLLFTGDVLNPELKVTATYQGTHSVISTDTTTLGSNTSATAQQQSSGSVAGRSTAPQVLVTLEISGTRNEPKTKISLQTKAYSDKDWIAWKDGDDEANAISYILSGQFRNELTDQQRMGLIGANLGLALASGMASGILSDGVRRYTWGYIQSLDVIYAGGQFNESADVRLTGQVGEAVIRAGGRVLNDIANANVSVELPFSTIVNSERYRNLILTLERRVEGIQNTEEQRRASNGVRLFYRFIF